jgi:tetratricopeptide (TPR) repeat protein
MTGGPEGRSTSDALAHSLQQGLSLQRSGRHADAERLYRTLTQTHLPHPDVLQLLALALKAQGKLDEAEACFRQSLSLNPTQAHVWNNLGNLMLSQRRPNDAVAAYTEAIALNGHYVEAWIGFGDASLATNDLPAAENAYNQARALEPQRASAQVGLAAVAAKREDEETTDKILRQVIARDPNNAVALHNLGISLARRGLGAEASALTERAIALRPARADMLATHAYALQLRSQFEPAIALYRQAVARDPFYIPAYENLSRLLWALGKHEAFTADLDSAIARNPGFAPLLLTKANLLGHAERFAEAREVYGRALALSDDPIAHDGYARMSAELGDAATAFDHHRSAVAKNALASTPRANYGHSLLRFGEYREAITVLDGAVDCDPTDQSALGILTLALRAANDPREQYLADYERFAKPVEVPVPRGYKDMASFNVELNRALDALHRTEVEPIDQTLRKGTQTLGSLFGRRLEIVDRLRERFDEVIRDYIAALPDDDLHPFLRRKASAFRYRTSWSSRLKDSGFHTTHIHPKGWISSAYYIELPGEVGDHKRKEGWFTLGEPPFDLRWNEPIRRHIQPKEGTLVLFPSYFYHGTVPFHSHTNRTTIAFDVVPLPHKS